MTIHRERGKDEFATFVVAAAILCVAAILYGALYLMLQHEQNQRNSVTNKQDQKISVQVVCPNNGWNTGVPVVNGNG